MPKLQLEVFYEIEGIRVDADALGSDFVAFSGDGIVVRVVLPNAPDSFTIPKFRGILTISNHDSDLRDEVLNDVALLHSGDKYEVRIVRAVANIDADTFPEVRAQLLNATLIAVTTFTEWVSVHKGQVWNAPSGKYPKRISPVSFFNLDDSTGGTEIGAKDLSIQVIPSSTEVTDEDLVEIGRLCVEEGKPKLAELLLAEGRHYLWRRERLAPDRAVLLAAMACELRIKTVIRELTDPNAQAWVEIVLDNPAETSVQASNLWHQALKAATGRSLSDEDKPLFKLLGRLITKRNHIVHRGLNVDPAEARELVNAAVAAFDWLRTVDHGSDS